MGDQAEKLRKMIEKSQKKRSAFSEEKILRVDKGDARIIAISSGKGGVGKTS